MFLEHKWINALDVKRRLMINIASLIVLALTIVFQVYNPFDPFGLFKDVVKDGPPITNLTDVLTVFLGLDYLTIFLVITVVSVNIFILMTFWDVEQKRERKCFFGMVFAFCYILAVSTSLFCFRLWSSDSAGHLLYVNKLVDDPSWVPVGWIDGVLEYGFFFYHHLFAFLVRAFNADAHALFLFVPQFITLTIYFIGIYFILFSKEPLVNASSRRKSWIFVIVVLYQVSNYPFSFSFSFMTPFHFVLSLTPLVVYCSATRLNLKKLACLAFLVILGVGSHVYGYFLFVIIGIGFLATLFSRNQGNKTIRGTWLRSLLLIILTILALVVLGTCPESFFSLVDALPITIDDDFFNGGGLTIFLLNPDMFNSITTFAGRMMLLVLYFGPIFSALVKNQLVYYRSYKKNDSRNIQDYKLHIFADLFAPFLLLSLFFGGTTYSLSRIIPFASFIYFMLFFKDLDKNHIKSLFLKIFSGIAGFTRKVVNRVANVQAETRSKKIVNRVTKITNLMVILCLSTLVILPFSVSSNPRPYSQAQYQGIEWLEANTPEDAIITTYYKFHFLVEAMSNRRSDYYCGPLFDVELSSNTSRRVQWFYSWANHSFGGYAQDIPVYIFIDVDENVNYILSGTLNGTRAGVGLSFILPVIQNSSFFELDYERDTILIYRIVP